MPEPPVSFPADLNPFIQPYVDFWTSCFQQANDTTRRMMDDVNGSADPRAFQRRWLEAVNRSCDAYMRSPQFLKAMKQNLDTVTQTKMQIDDLQKEFARNANIPTAGDVSGLFERLRGIEQLILARLGDIEERLGAIEGGLQVESTPNTDGDVDQAGPKKRSSRKKQVNSKNRKKVE